MRIILVLAALCLLTTAAAAQAADKITLKNGRVYEGRVLGKSDRRYLFAIEAGETTAQISFFLEEVDKIELDKQSVDRQIPYLKEVESLKVPVDGGKDTVYEMSLYKKGQMEGGGQEFFTAAEIRGILSEEEFEYYQKFLEITSRYADRLMAIDNLYQNLPGATPEDFNAARQSLDTVYYELNALPVPPLFARTQGAYLQFLKGTYLVFGALERGLLEEASVQMKAAEKNKRDASLFFRQAVLDRKKEASPAAPDASASPLLEKKDEPHETGNSQ